MDQMITSIKMPNRPSKKHHMTPMNKIKTGGVVPYAPIKQKRKPREETENSCCR